MSPEIVCVYVTNWNNDPWTLGPYSTLAVGGTPEDRRRLGSLIDNRLIFAGEHVSVDHPATMHGAYNSGFAAAEQLIRAHTAGSALIVGAGISGLVAAQHLRANGWAVQLLEATSSPGGRARTQTVVNGLKVHVGAAWIHGPVGNPIAALADQLDVEYEPNWPQRTLHIRRDQGVLDSSVVSTIDDSVSYVKRQLAEAAAAIATDNTRDVSMRTTLKSALAKITEPALRAAVTTRLEMHFESLMAANLDALSTQFGDEPYAYPGGDCYIMTYLQPIIDYLASDLKICFGTPVATIRRSETGVVVDSCSNESFAADVCIATTPLGVLQSGRVAFDPPLPESHQKALSLLSVGQKCKVLVQFDRRWWGDAQQIWVYPSQPTLHTEWAVWSDASHPQESDVHVLCGFLGGVAAERVQRQGQTQDGLKELEAELVRQFAWATEIESTAIAPTG